MEKTKESKINSLKVKAIKKNKVGDSLKITEKDIAFATFVVAGFFIGRVLVFDYMNPAIAAYLAIFLASGGAFYITCMCALFGIMTNVGQIALIEYLTAIFILGAANYFIIQNRITVTSLHKAIIGAFSVMAGGFICGALDGMNIYIIVIGLVEAIVTFSLCFIFMTAESTILGLKKTPILTNEQLISISVFMGICFVGMAGIEIKGIFLRDVLSFSSIMLLAYAGGAPIGCSTGLIFSIIMFAGAKYSASYTGILGVAGIMCGVFKDFGRAGSAAAFITGGLITAIYLERGLLTPDFLITIGVSALIFIAFPKNIMDKICYSFMANNTLSYEDYIEKLRGITADKLSDFSDSFKVLSNTFSGLSRKNDGMTQKEVSKLIDKVAESVCKDCPKFDACWKNNFYSTYQSIFALLAASDKKGYIAFKDIPAGLSEKCSDIRHFVEVTNRIFLIYKTDVKWHNKIVESRELVSQQLTGVSKIMDELSRELKFHISFNDKYENVIREELQKQKIGVDSLIVLENKYGRYEVDLTSKKETDLRLNGKKILTTISDVLGRKMTRDHTAVLGMDKGVKLKIIEEQKYNVTTGVARAIKGRGGVSGDNYTWMELKNGQCIVALSDGMGSGSRASEESAAAIEILEQFLESGFDKELAIKMINSILVLKSDEDFFTTLDLLCIDLYTGIGELVKIGAVETYLLRDGKVKVLRQSGLPAGILSNLDIDTAKISLKDGDIVLIVSDGIADAGRPDVSNEWLIDALCEFKSLNPQNIADYILERAKAYSGDKIKDDMTALALRVWIK